MEKITPAARREFSFPGPVDVHGERGDEQEKENDERQAALQSTKSKRIPVILSTHEAKNDEVVIRVVCLPRRSLGRRRVEAVACHAIANCEGGCQPQIPGSALPARRGGPVAVSTREGKITKC